MECPTCSQKLFWAADDEFEDLDGREYIESHYNCDRCYTNVTVTVPANLDYSNIPALGEE
jgi:DNA-directed RNA polymerase subunit RPC12/RpoP